MKLHKSIFYKDKEKTGKRKSRFISCSRFLSKEKNVPVLDLLLTSEMAMKRTRTVIGWMMLALVLVVSNGAFAQSMQIETKLDTTKMILGDQTNLWIKVTLGKGQNIKFPTFADTIVDKVEVIDRSSIDTIMSDASKTVMQQKLILTSFDSGSYAITAGPFVLNGSDTIWARPVDLYVNTLVVDTAKAIIDIKSPYDVPLEWAEVWLWLRWVVLGLVVLAGILGYLWWRRKNRPDMPEIELPKEPPHVIAWRELDKLKEEKLWQREKYKLYYSRLSDILRTYIEHQYGFPAMEYTSDEIIGKFKILGIIDGESFEKARQVLVISDLAKFAKYEPQADENELSFTNVMDFVSRTKSAGEGS